MNVLQNILQIVIALGIFNVWFLRFSKPSEWRGNHAGSMKDEFAVYGLPEWSVYLVGTLKVGFAALLLIGLFVPVVTEPAAVGLGLLMLVAVLMHIKVKDPPRRSLPAFTLLILCTLVAVL